MAAPHSKHKKQRDTNPVHRKARLGDTRIQRSAAEVAEDQRRLHARMRYEAAQEALRLAQVAIERQEARTTAQLLAEKRAVERAQEERDYQAGEEAKREKWSYGEARNLVREGYTIAKVHRITGWPEDMLEDVTVGQW